MKSTWSEPAAGANSLPEQLRSRWARWLNRRIPPASSITLDQRRIFIFPSSTGFFFFLCLLVMLLAAINYQNNLSYALTFLLANLFVVAVLHSYANLSGLTIKALGADDAFPRQRTAFRILLRCSNQRGHHALQLGWPADGSGQRRRRFPLAWLAAPRMEAQTRVDLNAGDQREVALHLRVGARGLYRPGRLRIESVYPLGLLRCWTWIDLDLQAIVYPAARAHGEPAGLANDSNEGQQLGATGDDEFYGLRDYREGDSPRRVFWKGLARGQELQSKDFAAAVSERRWVEWEDFPGLGTEARLSAMAFWVIAYHDRELSYGLRLPGTEIPLNSGDGHRDRALRALALFRIEDVA